MEDAAVRAQTAYVEAQNIATLEPVVATSVAAPSVGDALVPSIALWALVFGLALMGSGALLLVRRRAATA